MKKLMTVLVLALPAVAFAQQNSEEMPYHLGDATRGWVSLQNSGDAASIAESRPMAGEIADKVYARYLKTFDQPIPVNFSRSSFNSSGSGGGGSGGSSQ